MRIVLFWLGTKARRTTYGLGTASDRLGTDRHHSCQRTATIGVFGFATVQTPKRAQCARRHRASSPVRGAACCADGFLWLSSRAFCVPAGVRMCRLMCHCVRHISLDNKYGRSVKAIHSSRSRWTACTELCAGTHQEDRRTARRARWGARTVRGVHGGFGSPPWCGQFPPGLTA